MSGSGVKRNTAIVGVGMSRFQTYREDQDLVGLFQEGADLALQDAALDMDAIDMVVVSQAPDALHGFGHPEQTAVGALAIHDKPMLRVHTGGATGASAAQVGWWAVASGRANAVLVLGAEKMGDATRGAQEVLNKIWDQRYESLLPLNTITMIALSAVRHMHRHGVTERHFASIAARMRSNGALNEHAHLRKAMTADEVLETPLLAYPTRKAMACPRSTGSCAIVIANADWVKKLDTPPAWIRGFSSRSNTYFMGDKMGDCGENDHGSYNDLRLATQDAYRMAGISDPRTEVDVVEPYIPFSVMEPAYLEAMNLCDPGEAHKLEEEGYWDLDGTIAVSPSGGVVCANAISVSALTRVAEAAQQVRGRAGEHQVDGARTAVANGTGGSVQFYVTAVLGSNETVA